MAQKETASSSSLQALHPHTGLPALRCAGLLRVIGRRSPIFLFFMCYTIKLVSLGAGAQAHASRRAIVQDFAKVGSERILERIGEIG